MLVGEQDGRHLTYRPTDLVQGALDLRRRTPARQTGIDEDDAFVDHYQVDTHKTEPQLKHTVDNLPHELMMPHPQLRQTPLRQAGIDLQRSQAGFGTKRSEIE